MAMPGPSGFNQSIGHIKLDPEFEIKTEKCEDFDDKMCAIVKVKIEPEFEPEVEISDNPKLRDEEVVDKIVVLKRWLKTVPFKSVVEGSPFVPFKMPFIGTKVQPCPHKNRFCIAELLKAFPNIGLIVDLSNNRRTYRVSELMAFGVQYVSIPVKFEHQNSVPNVEQLNLFIETCSRYTRMNPGKLIGVHDQLGNRATAYMICKALEKGGLNMKQSMKCFNHARGYPIYVSLAGVLNGSRKEWITQSEFKPEVKRLAANDRRKTKKQRKAEQKGAKNRWKQPKLEPTL